MVGIVGIVIIFAMVFGGYIAGGGHMEVIIEAVPFEMITIGGAAVGSFALSNDMASIKHTLKDIDCFMRDAKQRAYIPGSSVKGAIRTALLFDAIQKAKEEQADILLVDTAGRLQNKVNLMKELDKIKRVIQREIPDAPHEVLLVLDATTGQNAMVQAKQFKETTDVTGLVLTKLDGTAKGGIVLAIRNELHLPVKLVGLGEGIDDLEPFSPTDFVVGLFSGLLE